MKNTTLLFRSLGIIILLTGTAHFFSSTFNKKESKIKKSKIIVSENDRKIDTLKTNKVVQKNQIESKENESYHEETDYIIGKWKVDHNSKEFKGTIVYIIKKENNIFNAYTYQYLDKKGNTQKAEATKTLSIKSFDGYKGEGIYKIEYEGKKYDVESQIDMVDVNTFKMSYEYYGYSDTETWKRH